MKCYVDADVLIWHLRRRPQAYEFLRGLQSRREYELWIGAMQRAEVLFFVKPEKEQSTLEFLALFKTAIVDERLIDSAAILYRQWNPTHGIDMNDAILAATAIETGGKIFTLNTKHYPMPDLILERAW